MFFFGLAVPLDVYQDLAIQSKFFQAFEALPAEERTVDQIVQLYNDLEQEVSYDFTGELTVDGDRVTGTTGTSGIAYGLVPKGDYKVSVDPIEGVDISYPEVVSTRPGGETIFIGIKEGKGKTKSLSLSSSSRKLVKEVQAAEALAAFRVEVYHDANANDRADQGEETLPWAGVEINLERISRQITYELTNGWNFIAFPIIPSSIRSAAELIQDVAEDGGYVTTVAVWDGDRWDEYSQRGDVAFGHDFLLEAGRAYFLENHTPATWTVAGSALPEGFQLPIVRGWNGVGIPTGNYTAEKVLDATLAEQLAQWDFGLWDVFVKRIFAPENIQTYGFDFDLNNKSGYFIYAQSDLFWKP